MTGFHRTAVLSAQRMTALSRLSRLKGHDGPSVLLTTVNAALQRVPAKELVAAQALSARPGNVLRMDEIVRWLDLNGFVRASTVREPGDYAVRGGIIDLYAPGMDQPVRLDFFGDTLESIRRFDPETQRTTDQLRRARPRRRGRVPAHQRNYPAVSAGLRGGVRRHDPRRSPLSGGERGAPLPGMEHWLPLFHTRLDTVFDYVPGTPIVLEPLAGEAAHERLSQISDYYQARKDLAGLASGAAPYHPLPPGRLYLSETEWRARLKAAAQVRLTPFAAPERGPDLIDTGTRPGRNFAPERAQQERNVFNAVRAHVEARQVAGERVVIAFWSEGARERLRHVLADHGLHNLLPVASWPEALARPKSDVALAVLGPRNRFRDRGLRDRRRAGHSRRPIGAAATGLEARREFHSRGDEPRGRRPRRSRRSWYRAISSGLQTSKPRRAARLPRTSLRRRRQAVPTGRKHRVAVALRQRGDDSRLDRLGGAAWQSRKARMKRGSVKSRASCIKVAAERQVHEAPRFSRRSSADNTTNSAPASRTRKPTTSSAAIDTVIERSRVGTSDGSVDLR